MSAGLQPPVVQRGVSSLYTGGPTGDGSGFEDSGVLPPFAATPESLAEEPKVRVILRFFRRYLGTAGPRAQTRACVVSFFGATRVTVWLSVDASPKCTKTRRFHASSGGVRDDSVGRLTMSTTHKRQLTSDL